MAKISGIFLGLVAFSAIIAVLGFTIGSMQSEYDVNVSVGFNKTYNKIDELSTTTQALEGNLSRQTVSTSGFFDTITFGAFKVVRIIFTVPKLVSAMLSDVSGVASNSIPGFPSFIPIFIMTIFIALIVFLIIAAIMRANTI